MQLNYGLKTVDFSPPENLAWHILHKTSVKSTEEEKDILSGAIDSLFDQLKDRIAGHSKLLVIVPDHTRRCGLEKILPLMADRFESTGGDVEFLVANGSHVIQPDGIIEDMVGPLINRRFKISQHDCRDEHSLLYCGTTSRGTPVWLNRKVKEADYIITIGGVLYHYFAGFGGGPKMIVPGIAGYETIRVNHRRTIDESTGKFHRFSREGDIHSNPVYLDLAEAVGLLPNTLSFQVVLDTGNRFAHAVAGPVLETHRQICARVKDIYGIPVAEKADFVVASAGGYPTDANLIQSHKAIHHAFQAVKKDGVLFVLAECREGIGSRTFLPYFDHGSSSSIGSSLLDDYQINGHTALALKSKTEQAKIIFLSDLAPDIVAKTGMIPATSMEQAMNIANFPLKTEATGYILPDAHVTVPEFVHQSSR